MTIYDIAKAMGVSASTVSRVINDKPGVHKNTKKRVLEYLDKHSYLPNEVARGLVNQASKIIGIVVSDMRTAHHTESVYYMEREFVKLGYCCIILNSGTEENDRAQCIQILRQRRVEAAILIGSSFQLDRVKKAIMEHIPHIPIVISNGYLALPNVYGVIADEQNGISNCVKLLVEKGRRNLAFIIDKYTPSNSLKQLGFEIGVRQWCNINKPLIMESETSLQGAYEATKKLVSEHQNVDGIIYAVDLLAVGGIKALNSLNIKVPEQISVIGVDNSIYAEMCTPTLTSLDNKLLDLSVTAVRTLTDAMSGKRVSEKTMIISSIVERQST